MNFKDYSEKASKTALYPNIGNNLVYPLMLLSEECGELVGKYAKCLRKGVAISEEMRQAMILEIGDVLWALSTVAKELGTSLDEAAEKNVAKLADRYNRGVIAGEGDYR